MPKAYIYIRALVKTDAPDGTPVTEQAMALRDEVHSNLESCGEDVLVVLAGAPPRDSLEKLGENRDIYTIEMVEKMAAGDPAVLHLPVTRGILRAAVEDRDLWLRSWADAQDRISEWSVDDAQGFDAIIELLGELNLIDEKRQDAVKARRITPDERGYYEPVNFTKLRQDIADWQLAGLSAATEVLAATSGPGIMAAFTKHHERLLDILAKHKLMSERQGVTRRPLETIAAASAADPRD